MSERTIVRDVETLDALLPTWYGRDFAFDIETTGLNYRTDRILGLALTFTPDETSYYIVLAHTEEVSEIVTKTRIEDRPTEAFETVETVTKSGQVRHKKVPITEQVTVEYEEEVKTYPLKEYISLTDFCHRIAGLFAQPDVVMAAHNFKFEKHFFNKLGVQFPGKVVDTQIAAQLVDENRDKGLKDLAPSVGMTDHVAYKQLAKYPGFGKDAFLAVPLELGAEYAMKDTESTWRLWEKFRVELAEEGVAEVFTDLSMPLLAVLQEMEAQGLSLDMEKVKEVRAECAAQLTEFHDRLWNAGIDMIAKRYRPDTIPSSYLRMLTPEEKERYIKGDKFIEVNGRKLPVLYPTERSDPRTIEFNPNSHAQIGELLYRHMKLTPPSDVRLETNADGSYKVDKDTLFCMRWALGDAAPQALQDIERLRKLDKFIGTYLDTFIHEADPDNHNSIHTTFSQITADTGRLSSYEPAIQNLPAHSDLGQQCRDMVIAKPGHSLICCDYSQLELRILAHYSQDEALLTAFANGQDLHVKTGAAFAGLTYEDLLARVNDGDPKAKKQRSVGKTGNFGLQYGMGPPKYQRYLLVNANVYVPLPEAKAQIAAFNELYAGAAEWKKHIHEEAHKFGYVRTIAGRKRRLPNLRHEDKGKVLEAERQAVNAIIQGSAADIIAKAMIQIQPAIRAFGASILIQVHDELVLTAPTEYAPIVAQIVQTLMVGEANLYLTCPLIADPGIGQTWRAAK